MTPNDLNRLIALSRRNPMGEAAVAWTTVWGFLVFGFTLLNPGFYFRTDAISLARIGLVLVTAGALAAALGWWHIRRLTPRIAQAKHTLQHMTDAIEARS